MAYIHHGPKFSFTSDLDTPRIANLQSFSKDLLQDYENNGFPFATVSIQPKLTSDSSFFLAPTIETGPFITFDSLVIVSSKKHSTAYFAQLLRIRKGTAYNEEAITRISERLKQVRFVKEIQPARVLFIENDANTYIYVEDRPSNSFDGIIGFQPNATTNRIVFTGDVTLKLENALRRGEKIDFQWRRLQEETQNLDISTFLPYLLQTRIGAWGDVEIYRRDSTFTQTRLQLSVGYLWGPDRNIRGFYENWSSGDLGSDIAQIDDVRIQRYGIAGSLVNLDFIDNPMKGYKMEATASAGLKTLTIDPENSTSQDEEQYQFELDLKTWIPVSKRVSFSPRLQFQSRQDTSLRLNEYFRVGGLNTLRGFDEESIFARSFASASLELKYRLDQTSAFFLFFDQGWYDRIDNGYFKDTPFGFGLGAILGTRNGGFRLVYALGSEQDNPILLRNGKVHFGFVNRF